MIYHIQDTRLTVKKVSKGNRPFANLEEYSRETTNISNAKVNLEDTIYVLWDFIDDDNQEAIETFRKLDGKKHLTIVEHQMKHFAAICKSLIFESNEFMSLIEYEGRKLCLRHYSIMN